MSDTSPDRRKFSLKLVDESKPTSDGRYFEPGTLSWRPLPLPLMAIRSNDPNGGHKNSIAIGSIEDVWRDGTSVYARGTFANDEIANEYIPLIEQGVLTGISADVVGARREIEFAEDGETQMEKITGGEIAAATLLPIPAFDDTRVVVTAGAGAPVKPPSEWFKAPSKDLKPYALTVDPDGRVHGFAAAWNTCHIGKNTCVPPPKSATNYAHFRIGEVETAEGERIATGTITMATNHAGIQLGAREAVEHYDHTGFAVADVAVYELDNGIWFGGALRPGVAPERVREFSGSGVSGDWRRIGTNLEMVGLLAVNTPGFPVPRPSAGLVDDKQFALVAAGMLDEEEIAALASEDCGCDKAADETEVELAVSDSEIKITEEDEEVTESETVEAAAEDGEELSGGMCAPAQNMDEEMKKKAKARVKVAMALVELSGAPRTK